MTIADRGRSTAAGLGVLELALKNSIIKFYKVYLT